MSSEKSHIYQSQPRKFERPVQKANMNLNRKKSKSGLNNGCHTPYYIDIWQKRCDIHEFPPDF